MDSEENRLKENQQPKIVDLEESDSCTVDCKMGECFYSDEGRRSRETEFSMHTPNIAILWPHYEQGRQRSGKAGEYWKIEGRRLRGRSPMRWTNQLCAASEEPVNCASWKTEDRSPRRKYIARLTV